MIYELEDDLIGFPDPRNIPDEEREEDGCIAIGGDLRVERLLQAYAMGIFPWSDYRYETFLWYCPKERFVIFPDKVHVSHSMRTLINKAKYRVSCDEDFESVIKNCSALRIDQPGAWLGPKMIEAYIRLHQAGYAHSVEVWDGEKLVGGLYGVGILHGFIGESMFSLVPNASKLALITLCRFLSEAGAAFVDCQLETPHLRSMGGQYISYQEYLDLLWEGKPVE